MIWPTPLQVQIDTFPESPLISTFESAWKGKKTASEGEIDKEAWKACDKWKDHKDHLTLSTSSFIEVPKGPFAFQMEEWKSVKQHLVH